MSAEEPPKKRTPFQIALRWVRIALGFSVLAVGLVMVALPGPALIVIPVGLAILATEYAWARRYLKRFKEGSEKIGSIFFGRRHSAKKTQAKTEDEQTGGLGRPPRVRDTEGGRTR